MQVLSSSDYSNGDNSNTEGNNTNTRDSSNNSAGSSSEEERRQFTSTEEEELTYSNARCAHARGENPYRDRLMSWYVVW